MTNTMSLSNATEGLMSLMKNGNQTNATQGNLMGLIEKGMSNVGTENMSKTKLEKLKDFMICSQVDEKTVEKIVKEMMKYKPVTSSIFLILFYSETNHVSFVMILKFSTLITTEVVRFTFFDIRLKNSASTFFAFLSTTYLPAKR